MKFYANNIDTVISKVKSREIRSLLLFGSDAGMISEFSHKVSAALNSKITDFESSSNNNLFAGLNNGNFFGEKEIIKIYAKSLKLDEDLKKILTAQNLNFPLLIADELETSSSIRKFYESTQNIAIIGCYPDDDRSIRSLIISNLTKENIQIEPDAINFLVLNLRGDRLLIKNEMIKLLTYSTGSKKITLEMCKNIISNSIETNPDELCIFFAKKDGKNFINQLNILKNSNINNIWIIRALSRYMQNHLIVKLLECDGIAIDEALKLLKPPIFFKYVQAFKDISFKLSKKEIANTLDILIKAEIDSKSFHDDSVMNNIFISHFKAQQ
jgi:DNA polymerase-3 subunit delta